jgi:hypothetical protein
LRGASHGIIKLNEGTLNLNSPNYTIVSYKYGGYGCRRCKKARRKLNQYDENDETAEDSISDDAIAAKMIGALRNAIIDTLALDPKSCLFHILNNLLQVELNLASKDCIWSSKRSIAIHFIISTNLSTSVVKS